MREGLKNLGIDKYFEFTGTISAFGSAIKFNKKTHSKYKYPTICIQHVRQNGIYVDNHNWVKFNFAFKKFGYGFFSIGTKIKFRAKIVKYTKESNVSYFHGKLIDYGLFITDVKVIKK